MKKLKNFKSLAILGLGLALSGCGSSQEGDYLEREELELVEEKEEAEKEETSQEKEAEELGKLGEDQGLDKEEAGREILEEVEEKEEVEKEIPQKEELRGQLLKLRRGDYIYLDGASISKGEEKRLRVELDQEGQLGEFIIMREEPNGVRLAALVEDEAMNLAYEGSTGIGFTEYGEIEDGYGIQISCLDLDQDGVAEVLVSIGNNLHELETRVYSFNKGQEELFKHIGSIWGQKEHILKEDNIIEVAFGSQGLYEEFKYEKASIYHKDSQDQWRPY